MQTFKRIHLFFALLLILIAPGVTSAQVTIVSNASIHVGIPQITPTEAFAHEDGLIVGVGKLADLNAQFPDAAQLDLAGATVIPGFIDAHGHLLGLGQSLMQVDLMGTVDKADIIKRLKDFEPGLLEGQWLLGRGWDQNDWPVKELPTAADLDEAFPERPVWIERVDGHAGWANTAALAFTSKELKGAWQPDGGEILRSEDGEASGVFIDNASALIGDAVPIPSDAELTEALTRAMDKTASVGLTAMHDAGTNKRTWDLLRAIKSSQSMKVRVYAMADGDGDMLAHLCKGGSIIDPYAMLSARAIKLYSDGALGSRGAALLAPYSDSPEQSGLLLTAPAVLAEQAKRAADCGLQVNIHAIGDRGNRVTLDALELASKADNPGRHRIEHSQVIEATDFARFKAIDLIASEQPTHATSDMYWAEDRVGGERIKGAYAWQKLGKLGIPLALGSDFPVEKPNPLHGFYAAVSRQDSKGWPTDGWYPEERLSREEALHGFTLGAAYAAVEEDQLGSMEVGKRADFVVLSKDIMTIPVEEILTTEVLATYLNGTAIYQQ
jgi:predicted amidohydrolase YtcJ